MTKSITLTNLCQACNDAITAKKIELLSIGKDYTKPQIVAEIIKEWKILKDKSK